MRIAMTLLALALATGACKKKENKPTGDTTGSATTTMTGSGSAAMAGSGMAGSAGSAMAGSGDTAGSAAAAEAMAKHAGNCPSTVLGSTSKADVKGKDVVLSITSDDKDAIAAIQKRTDEMLKIRMDKSKKGAGSGEGSAAGGHDQRGTHGGSIGLCPMHIPEGATAKAKHEKKGVTVTITPKDKPDELKTEIDARIAKAADWVSKNIKPGDKGNMGGVGGVKNNEGANHSGQGDAKGKDRKKSGGGGSGGGTGTGGGKGTGGGGGGSGAKK